MFVLLYFEPTVKKNSKVMCSADENQLSTEGKQRVEVEKLQDTTPFPSSVNVRSCQAASF